MIAYPFKTIDMKNIFEIEAFKSRILASIDSVDVDFEAGYCYKKMMESPGDAYWSECYCFLKGLAHYMGIACYR
jgi:hypothetical protein